MTTALQPEHLISAIGVLLGFQITAFSWRISRELSFRDKYDVQEKKEGDGHENKLGRSVTNGIAPSDWLNIGAIVLNVLAILLLLLGCEEQKSMALFGSGLVLFGTYPFALLGHYRMFVRAKHQIGSQEQATTPEVLIICLGSLAALVVGISIACAN